MTSQATPGSDEEMRVHKAMLRPEFQHKHGLKLSDYEVNENGYPVRKDRFESACRSFVNELYSSRIRWSVHVLKNHVNLLLRFIRHIDRYQSLFNAEPVLPTGTPKTTSIEFSNKSWNVDVTSPLVMYAIMEDIHVVKLQKQVSAAGKHQQENICPSYDVDVKLKDGTVLSACKYSPPVFVLMDHNGELAMKLWQEPTIFWCGVGPHVEVPVDSIVSMSDVLSENSTLRGVLAKFTHDKLMSDQERYIEAETTYQKQSVDPAHPDHIDLMVK